MRLRHPTGEGNANRMVMDLKRAKHCNIYSPVVVAVVFVLVFLVA